MSHADMLGEAPAIDPRVEFWSDMSQWPRETVTHSFLARVVLDLGPILFANEWTGCEPGTVLVYPLWPTLDSSTPQPDVLRATDILHIAHDGYRLRSDMAERAGSPRPMPTPDEWTIACALWRRISDETWSAFNRYLAVVNVLLQIFELNFVSTALRGYWAGEFQPLGHGAWINECYLSWFATCQVDTNMPYSRIPTRFGGDWIYVDIDSYVAWRNAAFREILARRDQQGHIRESANQEMNSGQSEEVAAQTGDPSPPSTRRKGGSKPKYDWPSFDAELLRRTGAEPPPRSIHALADDMLAWCSENWDREPAKSTARTRIARILREHGVSLD